MKQLIPIINDYHTRIKKIELRMKKTLASESKYKILNLRRRFAYDTCFLNLRDVGVNTAWVPSIAYTSNTW